MKVAMSGMGNPLRRAVLLVLACVSTIAILITAFRLPTAGPTSAVPDRKHLEPLGAMYKDPTNPLTNLSSEYAHLRDDMFTYDLFSSSNSHFLLQESNGNLELP